MLDVTEQPEFSVGTFSMDQRLEWSVELFNGHHFLCFLVSCRTAHKLSLEISLQVESSLQVLAMTLEISLQEYIYSFIIIIMLESHNFDMKKCYRTYS